jgi:hypothetical protein
MTDTEPQLQSDTTVREILESTIERYFATIEAEDFSATSDLFIEAGQLLAPFEKPIVGREAIAFYLSKEARGMKLLPQNKINEPSEDNSDRIKIVGKVKTSLFTVNVSWYFTLNSIGQIVTVRIKLLASPQELLNLQNSQEQSIKNNDSETKNTDKQ